MPYRPHGKAIVDPYSPRAFAICQRCGTLYNAYSLGWQFQWMGDKLQNKWIQVCRDCMDKPSLFLRQIIIPADPYPTIQPRTEPYSIDEAGGRDMPLFFSGAVALAQLTAPGWATGFWSAVIGGGAGGSTLNGAYPNMGGGGGAYAQTNAVPIISNQIIYYSVGAGGTPGNPGLDSWVSTANAAPTTLAQGCLAKAGSGAFAPPAFNPVGGLGGAAAACIGDTTYSGGDGGTALSNLVGCDGGTGGGGAAGPYGAGQSAPNLASGNTGGYGGDADGTRGVGTGGQSGANLNPGQPGRSDGAYAASGGAGGGGGGGGGNGTAPNGGVGGAGASYGGGGGGGGYAIGTNGPGGPGGPGFVVIRWLQL